MQNGTTYIVRPRIAPAYNDPMVAFIPSGSAQWLVGPASASSGEQMKVRSSTRATSAASVRAWNELGRIAGLSRTRVPARTSASVNSSHSAAERSEEHTSELQSRFELVCRLLPEKKKDRL